MTRRSIEDVRRDTDTLLQMERDWRDHVRKQDSGSYCEGASVEFIESQKVWRAIKEARRAIMNYEQ